MSVSYTAYVVYGGTFAEADLKDITKVRACTHAELNTKFCPECGKPMWVEVEEGMRVEEAYREGSFGYIAKMYDSQTDLVVGIILAKVRDNYGGNESWSTFEEVGNKVKGQLKQACIDLGLDMPNPRLHLVMYAG